MNGLDSNEEYAAAVGVTEGRPVDEQDRVLISALTDREIAVETLTYLRLFTDLMTAAAENPLLSKILPMPPGFSLSRK